MTEPHGTVNRIYLQLQELHKSAKELAEEQDSADFYALEFLIRTTETLAFELGNRYDVSG